MVKTVIQQKPSENRKVDKNEPFLNVSECFTDTIQGEGINAGYPATFLRMQYCTLHCQWCDTFDVWKNGNPYTIPELINLFEESGVISNLQKGQHLVLTGGSPLLQGSNIVKLINKIKENYGFESFVEVENECTLMPSTEFVSIVNCWNNSPKTSNSGNPQKKRFKPDVLNFLNQQNNSWFKFVIQTLEDWKEIESDFLPYISKNKILLMPEGESQKELQQSRQLTAELAIEKNVKFTDRLQVTIWDKATGV